MADKNISSSLKKLQEIVKWFEEQDEVDVEQGLDKVKEGAVLVKSLKGRLKELENEFEEVAADLDGEERKG